MLKGLLLFFLSTHIAFAQSYSFECSQQHINQMNTSPTNPKGCQWECVEDSPSLLKQVCKNIEEDLNCEKNVYTNSKVDRELVLNLSSDPSQRGFDVKTSGILNGGKFKNSRYECELKKLNWDGQSQPVVCVDYDVECKIDSKFYDCEDLKDLQEKMQCHPAFMEY